MEVRRGWLTMARWRGVPLRVHWSAPIGFFVLGGLRVVPGVWLGLFALVVAHELGHALLVRRARGRVVSLDVHGLGGECRWSGGGASAPLARAEVAWGGVLALAAVLAVPPPTSWLGLQLLHAFTLTNAALIALNLVPVAPLDGAEAWQLPRLWRAHQRAAAAARRRREAAQRAHADAQADAIEEAAMRPEVARAARTLLEEVIAGSRPDDPPEK
jgi:stage IV sporulation protein FB